MGRFAILPMIPCRGCLKLSNAGCQTLKQFASRSRTDLHLRSTILQLSRTSPLLVHHQNVAKFCNMPSEKYTMIYDLPTITVLRTLSRLKLIQTGVTAVILPPVYYYYLQGDVTPFLLYSSTGIAVFAAFMLYVISHFARRVVGRMYLDTTGSTLKVSHLTFWGSRNDVYMPVKDVMTITDTGDSPEEVILLLRRFSKSETMYYSTRIGRVVDRTGFQKVFGSFSPAKH